MVRVIVIITTIAMLSFTFASYDKIYQVSIASAPESEAYLTRNGDEDISIKPTKFKTEQGYDGWYVVIPGSRPLATPAIGEGLVFVGGGFGSYEFYAFDAKTGNMEWLFHAGDDGPTAAVYYKGRVAFNTESCILYVLDARSGNEVWSEWLGDPLMAQPAIYEQRIYMTYPGSDGHHYITCRDLESGKEYWKQQIVGEVITAPIIDADNVYCACLDGSGYCFGAFDGELIWKKELLLTSSPMIYKGNIYASVREPSEEKDEHGQIQYEGLGMIGSKTGEQKGNLIARTKADYLRANINRATEYASLQKSLDASVGFGSAPSAAKLEQGEANLGVFTVSGIWSYQGSRVVAFHGDLIQARGNEIIRQVGTSDDNRWKYTYEGKTDEKRQLVPPAVSEKYLFTSTSDGFLLCLSAKDGKEVWRYSVGEPMRFQPALWEGRVYFTTDTGKLYCIDTKDPTVTGWSMWGGDSTHNMALE
ncbi:MAG: outer membrane protein assembly factor BamB family protein [bacterium]